MRPSQHIPTIRGLIVQYPFVFASVAFDVMMFTHFTAPFRYLLSERVNCRTNDVQLI